MLIVAVNLASAEAAPCGCHGMQQAHGRLSEVLAGENAITLNRELMGNTNPKEAEAGTIRADFAESIDANAVHGSDSPVSAQREIAYFFESTEIFG